MGGVSGLSTKRKQKGITSAAHSMHPAKVDGLSQSCVSVTVVNECVFVIERE